jgi:hypothetical protein
VLTGPWRPVDPTTLPTVRTQTDPSVGPYESFRAPSAADTTIYRTQAGGYVFAAGFITWGEGLHGWGSAGTAWSVLDRLMSTVLRRMAGTD